MANLRGGWNFGILTEGSAAIVSSYSHIQFFAPLLAPACRSTFTVDGGPGENVPLIYSGVENSIATTIKVLNGCFNFDFCILNLPGYRPKCLLMIMTPPSCSP
jgi:hypothetical protein